MAIAYPPLTPQAAQVTTASVQIKTLTIDGQQATLAFFRQLYDEPLFDHHTWKAAGTPWFRVNHHDQCTQDGEHEHVIWQKGHELRRARIDNPGDLWNAPLFGYDDDAALCLAAGGVPHATIDGEATNILQARILLGDDTIATAILRIENLAIASLISNRHPFPGQTPEKSESHLRTLHETHDQRHPNGTGCASTRPVIEQRARQCTDWHTAANAAWQQIQTLEQVFLAA